MPTSFCVSCAAGIRLVSSHPFEEGTSVPWRVLSESMSLSSPAKIARKIYLKTLLGALSLTICASFVLADSPAKEPAKTFPAKLGNFQQVGRAREITREKLKASLPLTNEAPNEVLSISQAETEYVSADGEKLLVSVNKFENDSAAYCQFTLMRSERREPAGSQQGSSANVGTASVFIRGPGVMFFKGLTLVTVTSESGKGLDQATELARLLAATFDNGDGDIPVLVKHLPNWETKQGDALYAVSASSLGQAVGNQPIVKEVTFEGGTEAVIASYGQSKLVIVEFTTPQFSIDDDQRIAARIQELKNQGQPTSTAYRRVGNYSVFVFDGPDEKAANQLIDQVKYEQVVQWLGDDPHLYERMQRYFAQTSAGVLVAVLKSSGLSLIVCLAAGVLLGALLFRHRRAQKEAAYSDAGGSVRLNLDELTSTVPADRLLGPGSTKPDPNGS